MSVQLIAAKWRAFFEQTWHPQLADLAKCEKELRQQGTGKRLTSFTPSVRLAFFSVPELMGLIDELTADDVEWFERLIVTKLSYLQYWPKRTVTASEREWLIVALNAAAGLFAPLPPEKNGTILRVAVTASSAGDEDTRVVNSLVLDAEHGQFEQRNLEGDGSYQIDGEKLSTESAKILFSQISRLFATWTPQPVRAGRLAGQNNWLVEITYDDGHVRAVQGQVFEQVEAPLVSLSNQIRKVLASPNLTWFDSPTDEPIVALNLGLNTQKPDYLGRFLAYSEQITLDYLNERAAFTQWEAYGEVAHAEADFIPGKDTMGPSPLAWWDLPAEKPAFSGDQPSPISLSITTPNRVLQRWLIPDHPPVGWWQFAQSLKSLFGDHILTSNNLLPLWFGVEIDDDKTSDEIDAEGRILVVSVVFRPGGKRYDYSADSFHPKIGSRVLVPVGQDDEEKWVTVVDLQRKTPAEISRDFPRLKSILDVEDGSND